MRPLHCFSRFVYILFINENKLQYDEFCIKSNITVISKLHLIYAFFCAYVKKISENYLVCEINI